MTTTVPNTTSDAQEPIAPRRILALLALADELPMPGDINLVPAGQAAVGPRLRLWFESHSEAAAWCTWLGGRQTSPVTSSAGTLHFEHDSIYWHGWVVSLVAITKPESIDQLDADTRAQLEQVADVTPTGGAS